MLSKNITYFDNIPAISLVYFFNTGHAVYSWRWRHEGWRCSSPGAGFTAAQQLCESVQQRHTDGSQQSFKAGLHEFTETLHQTALTTVHFILRGHHVRDERVVGSTRLEREANETIREENTWHLMFLMSMAAHPITRFFCNLVKMKPRSTFK